LGAVVFGHQQQQAVIDLIHSLVEEGGKPLWDWQPVAKDEDLVGRIGQFAQPMLDEAFGMRSKQARSQKLKEISAAVASGYIPADADTLYANNVKDILFGLQAKTVREQILR